jgi:NADH-quinone oxidoreductase subunit F
MLIAAYAIGAAHGYLYIRGEYPRAHQVLQQAIDSAREAGYLGDDILGSGMDFTVELRKGAGAYICGEETALFESIEGKRGFPRIKPPFPTTHGLFGKPTVINNVETFTNVPFLIREGVEAYQQFGSPSTPGPRLFSLSGSVAKPGIYELARPVTLRQLIYDLGGGMKGESDIQAILLGGAAGKFVHPRDLDLELSEEAVKEAGLTLGSAAVMVFNQATDLRDILLSLAGFFAHESCGKCYPCQLGTQRQVEILERLHDGQPLPTDKGRLQDVGWTMTDASLCGLGQTAALAVLSAMELWPEVFEEAKSNE